MTGVPPPDGRLVELLGAEVDYGGRPALGPLDLAVRTGDRLSIVGPSGCGKSTALRLLAGLERPTRGRAFALTGRGETAMVFQSPTLAPWLDAAANVALPLRLAREGRASARSRAIEALERVGLKDAARLHPAQLSGGMAMRVSLARALVAGPRLLLLDEPFAALDEIARRRLVDDVLALAAQSRLSLVFVTHSVEEAVYMGRRVLVLAGSPGRVVAEVGIEGPAVRPEGFRTAPAFRDAVETVSAHLEATMGRGVAER